MTIIASNPSISTYDTAMRPSFYFQGKKYKSRRAAFKSLMEKDSLPSKEKDQMLKCLSFEVKCVGTKY